MKPKFSLLAIAVLLLGSFARGDEPSATVPSIDSVFSHPGLASPANAEASPVVPRPIDPSYPLKASPQLAEVAGSPVGDRPSSYYAVPSTPVDTPTSAANVSMAPLASVASTSAAPLPPTCGTNPCWAFDGGQPSPTPEITFGNNLTAVAGFAYLRPAWGNRGFNIAVPSGTGGSGLILGDARDVLHNFNFAPRVDVDYRFWGLGAGIRASGWAYNLSGTLDETLNSAAGSASLHAQSTLGLSAVNLPEATCRFHIPCCKHFVPNNEWLSQFMGDVSVGARYSSLSQTFDATVMSGSNVASLHSDQSFSGLGVTGALAGYYPIATTLLIYTSVRGSALFGTNKRDSTYTTMGPAAATAIPTVLTDNKSDVIPVGELDAGVTWGKNVGKQGYGGQPPPTLVFFSGGFTGQVWGNTAMISAASSPNFGSSALYLVGFVLTLGFGY